MGRLAGVSPAERVGLTAPQTPILKSVGATVGGLTNIQPGFPGADHGQKKATNTS